MIFWDNDLNEQIAVNVDSTLLCINTTGKEIDI